MNQTEIIEVVREAIMISIQLGTPVMMIGLVVGLAIALLQALTQVQEATLTFVPKIVVILIVMATTGAFTGAHIFAFTERVYGRIERGF